MARNFAIGAGDFIVTPTVNAVTLRTFAAWCYLFSYPTPSGRAWEWRDVAGSNANIEFAVAGSNVLRVTQNWSTTAGIWTVPGPSTGVWAHVVFTYDGGSTANNPVVYINGVSQTVTRTTAPIGTLNANNVGSTFGQRFGGSGNEYDGALAEAALWNRILNASEVAALGAGFTPDTNPRGLLFYYPLIGKYSPEADLAPAGAGRATVTNTVQQDHAPVRRKTTARNFLFAAGAGATGYGSLLSHTRNRLVYTP